MCLIWSQNILVISLLCTGCSLGYSYWLVVWNPLFLDPSDGVAGRFDRSGHFAVAHLHLLFVCIQLHSVARLYSLRSGSYGILAVACCDNKIHSQGG